ncbi:class I SAM-dependent methyltransferase [bacterium]|nr:class I SAM-dependent methyltransferase [bacterium]
MDASFVSSPLDQFLYEAIKDLPGRKLDYGCGNGRFLRFCEQRGLEVLGTDAFEYHYKNWDRGHARVTRIVDDVAPYPDDSFSCVVSNMVFEHVPREKMLSVASEVCRLLAPGGRGIFIFPTQRTLVEGHVGVPFAHWVGSNRRVLGSYLSASYGLGIGYWRSDKKRGGPPTVSRDAWVSRFVNELNDTVHYSSLKRWSSALAATGCHVRNSSYQLAVFAAPPRVKPIVETASKIFALRSCANLLVEARLGVVLEVTKQRNDGLIC